MSITRYTFRCENDNCNTEFEVAGRLSEGPPNSNAIKCPNCSTYGHAVRVWTDIGVIWAASGFAGNEKLDIERSKGEYSVPRKK